MMERLLGQPHAILAITMVGVLAGVLAYIDMPMNLFPDTNRPVVSVVTQWPGAAADDVATDVTHLIEVRLSAIDGVRRVTSTSRDQVSAVQVEFEYSVPIDTAATAVNTELPRVRSLLPAGIRDPLIFKITDAARPAMVLAITSAPDSHLSLGQLRQIAENPLRDRLLNIPGVAEAEVFGGDRRQVAIDVDRDALQSFGLTIGVVAATLQRSNISIPSGEMHTVDNRYLLTTQTLAKTPEDLAAILIPVQKGDFVRLGDIAVVHWGAADATSLYRGNGQAAVAVSLLRGEAGYTREVLKQIQAQLPAIRMSFPSLDIQVADTQARLIDLTVDNMLSALRDAVIMTLVVILLFLGNSRAALITALSLPFTYILTFAAMRALGYEFDMVTLTAIIIAVGLLADDAIVVIENIERRVRGTGRIDVRESAAGTSEILLADASGTISTIIVLVPIMFIGGYVETVLRPLTVTLSVALLASLIVSVTIIPLLVPIILRPGASDPLAWLLQPFERFVLDPLRSGYIRLVAWGLDHRALVLIVFALMFVASLRQMPLLGRELMPLMDTGIIKVTFEAEPNSGTAQMDEIAKKTEAVIQQVIPKDQLLSTSTVLGAEAGVKSFGAARLLQQGEITVNLVDRFQRKRSLFEIEKDIRAGIHKIPGLISANVTEFGATPLSSLRATVDIMLTGPDPAVLSRLADEVLDRLQNVKGLTGVERTWQNRSRRLRIDIDEVQAKLFGLTAADIAGQVSQAVGGTSGGLFRITGENPILIWVRLQPDQRNSPEEVAVINITTPGGQLIPLALVATLVNDDAPSAETHQALLPTVDVLGYRRSISVTHLHENIAEAIADIKLPAEYQLSYEGEYRQLQESFGRLGKSLVLGLALLYLMLVITFRSFRDASAIMLSLPLAVIGAAWAMMFAGKHGCLPAFMGVILLMGIAVNNGILLVDFAKVALGEGKDLRDAILEAVRLRTRPILMTAGASAVGMIPIALEWAVGIERLSPLAVVAIGGLLAGTFFTLLVVPILFHILYSGRT